MCSLTGVVVLFAGRRESQSAFVSSLGELPPDDVEDAEKLTIWDFFGFFLFYKIYVSQSAFVNK